MAGMTVRLRLTMEDGQAHDVVAGAADFIAFEDHFDLDGSELAKRQRVKWLAFLAWSALGRRGVPVGDFADFSLRLQDIELGDNETNGDGLGEAPEAPG